MEISKIISAVKGLTDNYSSHLPLKKAFISLMETLQCFNVITGANFAPCRLNLNLAQQAHDVDI